MKKILVYELNEVPWRVIDFYVSKRPGSFLENMLARSSQYTTHTKDSGELHPWSTWPTMHRGVTNDTHNVRYINQDLSCAKSTPPLWKILAESSKTVGICGCLQSYPPLKSSSIRFHIPDTFAPGSDAFPDRYSAFQRVNLKLTGENKATAGRLGPRDFMDGLQLFRSGVSFRTGALLAGHLVRERVNAYHKALRAIMQAYVAFDVFMDALRYEQPDYAAFFSNHVAGMMHRYWKYAFPEDFGLPPSETPFERFHSQSILKAMDIFDSQLGILETFCRNNSYDLIVVSSMGQEAVDRGEYVPELKLDDETLLARHLCFPHTIKLNLAMQPDAAFEFTDPVALDEFRERITSLTDTEGKPVFVQRYKEQGATLNLSTARSKAVAQSGRLAIDGELFDIKDLGFSLIQRDQGTGYHQPEGILLWSGASQPRVNDRRVIDSRQYAPTILKALSVPRPEYMMDPVF